MTALVILSMLLLIVIQSILGVGLLVFGVPILTICGLEYLEVVGLLLPSSLTISILQLVKFRCVKTEEFKHLPAAILGLLIGLTILTEVDLSSFVPHIIGTLMLLAALLRTNAETKRKTERFFRKNRTKFHLINATIHGFTNLGGVLLTVYSSSVYQVKVQSVLCTAQFYFVYALSQLIILVALGQKEIFGAGLTYVPVTAMTYITLGNKSFMSINQIYFEKFASLFFVCAGSVILLRNIVF